MGDLRAYRYRECSPRETVERVRGILSGLRLLPVESEWRRSGEVFFSLRLSLPGTSVGVNGKGVTPEYALASAYGELMERLQNMADFRLRADMPSRSRRYGGFLYAPDEIPQNMGEILASEIHGCAACGIRSPTERTGYPICAAGSRRPTGIGKGTSMGSHL